MANPRPVDSGVFVGFDVSGALDAWKLPEVSGLFGGLDALKSPSVSAAAGLDVSAGLNAWKLPEVSGLFGGLDALKPLSVSAVAGLDVSGGLDAWKLPEVSGSFGGLDALKPLSVSAVAGLDVSGGLDAWKLPEVSGSFGGLDALKPLSVSAVAGLDVSGGLDGWKLPEVSGSFGGLDALKPLSVSAAVGLDVSGGLDAWKLPEVGGLFGGLDALKPLSVSVRSSLHRRAMRYIGGPSSRSRPSGYALEDTPPPQPVGVVEIDAFLEQTLGELNPAFLAQFRGAMQRSEERGPDWWTQAAASERKLFLGVLHTAAPDELVLPWVTNPKQQIDRCGHPTRRTKIGWLCQSIPNEKYREFVIAELESALALLDVLHAANHVDEFPEFEKSFSWTELRLKVAIRHIVEIWLTNRQGS